MLVAVGGCHGPKQEPPAAEGKGGEAGEAATENKPVVDQKIARGLTGTPVRCAWHCARASPYLNGCAWSWRRCRR